MRTKYYIGLDLGSSSIKVALVNSLTGKSIGVIQEPKQEMHIKSLQRGWAEQDPLQWWSYVCNATKKILKETEISADDICGIGIAYQMHGLVLIDKNGSVLRDSIIWCDSRAVAIGAKAYEEIGKERCKENLLNSPANFTASKLKWVKENEPEIYQKIYKFLLPGDFIAYKFTDSISTTPSGLSEGILWDFKKDKPAIWLLDYYGIDKNFIPEYLPTFSNQGSLTKQAAKATGLHEGIPILYRAGDQPNNALSLNVLEPGEIAATGGTSGVVYAVTNNLSVKESTRVNNFVHVNHQSDKPRIGKLLNINGAGIQYRWLKENLNLASYKVMNELSATIDIGSNGVVILPFGNGAERMLNNKTIGTQIFDIDLNRHNKANLCRASLEGIAFSFVYGINILKQDGIQINVIKTGNDNLFQSEIFSNTIATLIDKPIEIYNTTGAIGAARAAGITDGSFKDLNIVTAENDHEMTFYPQKNREEYELAYYKWKNKLEKLL